MMTYYFINPAPGVVCLYLDGCLVMKCWLDLVAEFGEVKISVGYVLWMCWSFSQVGHTSVEPVDPNKQKVIQWTYTWFTFYSIIFYFIIFLYLQQFRSSGDFLNRDTLVQIFTGYNAACWTLQVRAHSRLYFRLETGIMGKVYDRLRALFLLRITVSLWLRVVLSSNISKSKRMAAITPGAHARLK